MSEVKGTLLTIILALSVFAMVFGIVNGAVKEKADAIEEQLRDTEPKTTKTDVSYANI